MKALKGVEVQLQKLWKHFSNIENKDTEKNSWHSKIKWRVEDPHQSRVDESV
jgi:hypothetical protein